MPVAPQISTGGQFQGHFGGQNKFDFVLQAKGLVRKCTRKMKTGPPGPVYLATGNFWGLGPGNLPGRLARGRGGEGNGPSLFFLAHTPSVGWALRVDGNSATQNSAPPQRCRWLAQQPCDAHFGNGTRDAQTLTCPDITCSLVPSSPRQLFAFTMGRHTVTLWVEGWLGI